MVTLRAVSILLIAFASATCGGAGTTVSPGTMTCELGPLPVSTAAAALCNLGTTGCPLVKPMSAQSLVSVASCVYGTGDAPCTTLTSTCPLVNPSGNTAIQFPLANERCADVVRVLVQASGDGGAGIEWRVQEQDDSPQGCIATAPERVGVANVDGACCSTTIDVPLTTEPRTFRFTVRTDWRE